MEGRKCLSVPIYFCSVDKPSSVYDTLFLSHYNVSVYKVSVIELSTFNCHNNIHLLTLTDRTGVVREKGAAYANIGKSRRGRIPDEPPAPLRSTINYSMVVTVILVRNSD